ncbi:MAG: CDP-glucose 4,6-dehydratase [Bacteroidetes bacterium]|nr:CDP-glucose 4,6-dehydratase [Bacteroidota bacterium]
MEKLVNLQLLTSYYKGKKVFVTGHTGFKGSWLIAWLHKLGAITCGYALEPEYDECLFNILKSLETGESIINDIRDKENLKKAILDFRPDFIFHLAAQPLVRRSYSIPAETFEVNAIGTANVLETLLGLEKKCTVIVVTTDKVYENKELDILYHEADILGGFDPYSASKACTELVVNSFRNSFFHPQKILLHNKAIASVRAGNVIGGGDYSEDRIIPDIVRSLSSGKTIEVRNPGSVRPWQHVLEPLGGYLLLGGLLHQDPVKYSGAYNFGPNPDDHLQVQQLVEQAIQIWGKGSWRSTGNNNNLHEAGILKLDISTAQKILNWHPKLSASNAIEWTINWYREKGDKASFTLSQINNYMNA